MATMSLGPFSSGLGSLPRELQYQIICQLDPVGLISLSQCNRYFAALIDPGKKEWAEWLLVKELDPENGGSSPTIFKVSFSSIVPWWSGPSWSESRWACTDCLRLLPHIDFDNHSLMRMGLKKPPSGSPSDRRPGYDLTTSWNPVRRHANRKTWSKARRYYGDQRFRRRCNECRFQAGQLGPQLSHWGEYMGGTKKVPILRSRQVEFMSPLDRWFPGLAGALRSPTTPSRPDFPPLVLRPMRWGTATGPWTMYMVRCPRCERWQEMREFRFGGTYANWKPSHDGEGRIEYWTTLSGESTEIQLDDASCNACFAREHGREALATALAVWLDTCLSLHRWDLEGRMFSSLWLNIETGHWMGLGDYKRKLKRQLHELDAMRRRMRIDIAPVKTLGYADVAELRLGYESFRSLWRDIKARHPRVCEEIGSHESFVMWLENFRGNEAHWRWVAGCQAEVEENPGVLADWALSRDGASLH